MRDDVWRSMLDSDLNARYWKSIVRKYSTRDKGWKIFLAVMASGTVATWGIWESLPALWKTLSGISAVVAIALPIFNYPKIIGEASSLAGKWGELRIEYEDLWRQVNSASDQDEIKSAFAKYRKIESTLQGKESDLPDDKELLAIAFADVKKSRGI